MRIRGSVETEGQRRFLREHPCDRYQGFLLGKPQPPEKPLVAPCPETI